MKIPLKFRSIGLAVIIGLAMGPDAIAKPKKPKKPDSPEKAVEKTEEEKKPEAEKESEKPESKAKKSIRNFVKEHDSLPGLFPIYQDPESGEAWMVIKGGQIDREFIYCAHIVDGLPLVGHNRGSFRDNYVFSIRKQFNKIEFVAENHSFYFDPDSALSRAAGANVPPAVLASSEIEIAEKNRYLIKLDPLFLTEKFHRISPNSPKKRGGVCPRKIERGEDPLGPDPQLSEEHRAHGGLCLREPEPGIDAGPG